MDYALDSKLREKADTWQLYELQSKIKQLEKEISDLKSKNDYWQGKFNNVFRAMDELITLLCYKEQDSEHENILQSLKQYLY